MPRLLASLVATFLLTTAAFAADKPAAPHVVLETNHGDITLELFAQDAPETVANFLAYVRAGHYDGTIFHRVIADFMIQGGGFDAAMARKKTERPITNEADNGLTNIRGSLAMARTQDPHSASAQFFINLKNNDFLNHSGKTPRGWGYAVFGRVSDGMRVVDQIGKTKTGRVQHMQDVPLEAVVIKQARILQAAATQ